MAAHYGRIGIVGAGAWGTALTTVARRQGREVVIWAREAVVVEAINNEHRNTMFLPEAALDPQVRATGDPAEVCDADAVLLVVPGQFLRGVCESMAPDWPGSVPAVICAKGIEEDTGALMTEAVEAALPGAPQAVLSGPTFAAEVAKGLPTAVTIACEEDSIADALIDALGSTTFRTYRSTDLVGAEIGGAVKNVLAIACGIVTGRELGSNARAALITRGLAEMLRLGEAKGARRRDPLRPLRPRRSGADVLVGAVAQHEPGGGARPGRAFRGHHGVPAFGCRGGVQRPRGGQARPRPFHRHADLRSGQRHPPRGRGHRGRNPEAAVPAPGRGTGLSGTASIGAGVACRARP